MNEALHCRAVPLTRLRKLLSFVCTDGTTHWRLSGDAWTLAYDIRALCAQTALVTQ